MSNEHIVRAWKDADYRSGLSAADRAMVPDNPAGLVELSDVDLLGVEGGSTTGCILTSFLITLVSCSAINTCSTVSCGCTP